MYVVACAGTASITDTGACQHAKKHQHPASVRLACRMRRSAFTTDVAPQIRSCCSTLFQIRPVVGLSIPMPVSTMDSAEEAELMQSIKSMQLAKENVGDDSGRAGGLTELTQRVNGRVCLWVVALAVLVNLVVMLEDERKADGMPSLERQYSGLVTRIYETMYAGSR